MAKIPYLPFYVGDWTLGTQVMTAQEKGVYIDLLAHEWSKGFIPSEMSRLIKINNEVEQVWPEVSLKFIELEPGKLINEKLEEVRGDHKAFKKKQSENGSKGGRPKAKQNPKESQTKPIIIEGESEGDNDFEFDSGKGVIGEKPDFEEVRELANKIGKFFSVPETTGPQNWGTIFQFVEAQIMQGKKQFLIDQFEGYAGYKTEAVERPHYWRNYIGIAPEYDGKWKESDWEDKYRKLSGGNSEGTDGTIDLSEI